MLSKERRTTQSKSAVKALQRDLRALGYLLKGIDGDFGGGTELAVKGLQHDLLHNRGEDTDRSAPADVVNHNDRRVTDVTDIIHGVRKNVSKAVVKLHKNHIPYESTLAKVHVSGESA